jgi:hypothetical protein
MNKAITININTNMFCLLTLRELKSMKKCISLNLNTIILSPTAQASNHIEPVIRQVIELICYYEEYAYEHLLIKLEYSCADLFIVTESIKQS